MERGLIGTHLNERVVIFFALDQVFVDWNQFNDLVAVSYCRERFVAIFKSCYCFRGGVDDSGVDGEMSQLVHVSRENEASRSYV